MLLYKEAVTTLLRSPVNIKSDPFVNRENKAHRKHLQIIKTDNNDIQLKVCNLIYDKPVVCCTMEHLFELLPQEYFMSID